MIGICSSGIGNTERCIRKLVHLLDESAQAVPTGQKEAVYLLSQHGFIVFAYLVQSSNIPVMVKDLIKASPDPWKDKKVLCVVTMGLFSEDGAGCSAWSLKKYGVKIVGDLHIHIPDSVCDVRLLKESPKESQEIIREVSRGIEKCAEEIRKGKYPRNGLHPYNRIAGPLCQRLWYYGKIKSYSDKLKISNVCIGCSLCARLCPTNNLTPENDKATAGKRCAMCYRCISLCPAKTITLLGRTVIEQCHYGEYVKKQDDKNLYTQQYYC